MAADLATRGETSPAPSDTAAFRLGAEEANPVGGDPLLEEARAAADAALARGEDEYLKARLRGAEKQFELAADGYLSRPESLDAERAARALTLLAQVHLALGRSAAAEAVVARALREVPGYPGAVVPPPEVAALISALRSRPASRPAGRLRVESEVPGVAVRVAGLPLGPAPIARDDLPARPLPVVLTAPNGEVLRVVVDLSSGPATVTWRTLDALRADVAAAARAGDETGLFTAAARIEATTGAAQTCLALLDDGAEVLVVRLAGRAGRVLGGRTLPLPPDAAGYRALGRACHGPAAGELSAAEASRRLFRDAVDARTSAEGPEASLTAPPWVVFGLAGLATAAAGFGGYFAWQATAANDRYDRARSPAAADREADTARSAALRADLGLGAAVVLGGTALVLSFGD
jgi:hypothetical protein